MHRLCLLVLLLTPTLALDNGLALTPPMGWLSWERFRCNVDCENDPENCISEHLYKDMADRIASDGYKQVGYEYVIIDDCWMEKERDSNGKVVADKNRFPNGIKHLADYVHNKGLKFGIYTDYGEKTCAGYPGLIGHMEDDANTFAEWEVDYLKVDGCFSDPATMDVGYPEMGKYLNATGRPIVYSCEWPLYQNQEGMSPNYAAIAQNCNLWRNYHDIDDSLESFQSIVDFYAKIQDDIVPHAGPGAWNDPDMLIIGNFGLSYDQAKSQMAMWAVLASPLLMSVDLRTIKDEFKDILKNTKVIAVNQDVLGHQAKRILKENDIEVWVRPITPKYSNYYSYAVVFLSRRVDGMPYTTSVKLQKLGFTNPSGYKITDLFDNKDYGHYASSSNFTTAVNPTGVVMIKAEAVNAAAN